jgi:galactokinase
VTWGTSELASRSYHSDDRWSPHNHHVSRPCPRGLGALRQGSNAAVRRNRFCYTGDLSAEEEFRGLFSRSPRVVASAHGRVNLIGEHTDYNDGYVLPTAIPQRTVVAIAPRTDRTVRVASAQVDGPPREYALGAEVRQGDWLDYVAGLTFALGAEGVALSGFDARISSDVPLGSGVSSSAALLVALLRALGEAFALRIDDLALARLARRAETDFVGAPVGIMDPMACLLCDERTALFLDTRSLSYERVALPAAAEIVVISSGVAHDHARGDYRTRREECVRACAALGVASLRDVEIGELPRVMRLPDPLGRRARHVIGENARVLRAVEAMRDGDMRVLGSLWGESHASMRDDYEVSVPAVDRLVSIAEAESHVFGARLTGGGFGGSVVVLVERGTAASVAASIARRYTAAPGATPRVLVPREGC